MALQEQEFFRLFRLIFAFEMDVFASAVLFGILGHICENKKVCQVTGALVGGVIGAGTGAIVGSKVACIGTACAVACGRVTGAAAGFAMAELIYEELNSGKHL